MAGKNVAENLRDNEGKTLEGVERTGDSSEISAAEKGEGENYLLLNLGAIGIPLFEIFTNAAFIGTA